jgi:hypothetical protein
VKHLIELFETVIGRRFIQAADAAFRQAYSLLVDLNNNIVRCIAEQNEGEVGGEASDKCDDRSGTRTTFIISFIIGITRGVAIL